MEDTLPPKILLAVVVLLAILLGLTLGWVTAPYGWDYRV